MCGVLSHLEKAEEESWYLPRKSPGPVVPKELRETEEKAEPGSEPGPLPTRGSSTCSL